MQHLEANVVVVSAGTAGLSAAVAAAENGARVIVFEKSATIGGSGNMAMGPLAIESKLARLKKIALTREQAFSIHMNFTHWRVDARLVKAYYDKSADTIDWLENMGVEFADVQNHNYGYNYTWHIIKGPLESKEMPGTGIAMMRHMANRAHALGVKIHLRTPVRKILKEGRQVVGVLAENDYGDEIQAIAKAVVIATGGCGDNIEMIKKYTGFYKEMKGTVPGLTGDGIRMAWEVGAAPTDILLQGGVGFLGLNDLGQLTITSSQPHLFVNLHGDRFMNEEIMQTTPFGPNAIIRQKNSTAFAIFDENTKRHYIEEDLDYPPGILVSDSKGMYRCENFDKELNLAFNRGLGDQDLFAVDSIEELASKTGINPDGLRKTIDQYNKICDTGRDDVFDKNARFLRPVRQPKFYAFKLTHSFILGTLGGIKINYKTEVVNKNDDAIPGLYAAGSDANSIYGDTYIFILPGNTLGFALNSGRIAGEEAAKYAKAR